MSPESSGSEEGARSAGAGAMPAGARSALGGAVVDDARGRAHFQQQLQQLEAHALDGLNLIVEQLDRVLEALDQQDVELAQMVIADDDRVDGRYLEVHQGILSLLALQAPVAGDLRLVAALLHIIKHIERMGAYARSEVVQAKAAFISRDVALAEDLVRQDREINRQNRAIFNIATEIGDDPDTREWAMLMILVARALERIGDNAVDIGEQVAFVVTGLFREFSDSSHPFSARHGAGPQTGADVP